MTLPVPSIDDRSFDDLLDEALSLIPTHMPEWTNYNASDPGITLLELLVWLTEMLIYRADQITEEQKRVFLRLLGADPEVGDGANGKEPESVDDALARTIAALRASRRAVTVVDYEAITLAALRSNADVPGCKDARVCCVPRHDLSLKAERDRTSLRSSWVSVVVLPGEGQNVDDARVRGIVDKALQPRRLATTRVEVVEPVWVPVSVEVIAAVAPDFDPKTVRADLVGALERFLDPRQGGRLGRGWPFGAAVHASDMWEVVARVRGVDRVVDVHAHVPEPGRGRRPGRWTEGRTLYDTAGDGIGVALQHDFGPGQDFGPGVVHHQLPDLSAEDVFVAAAHDVVPISITVTGAKPDEVPSIRQTLRKVVRDTNADAGPKRGVTVTALSEALAAGYKRRLGRSFEFETLELTPSAQVTLSPWQVAAIDALTVA